MKLVSAMEELEIDVLDSTNLIQLNEYEHLELENNIEDSFHGLELATEAIVSLENIKYKLLSSFETTADKRSLIALSRIAIESELNFIGVSSKTIAIGLEAFDSSVNQISLENMVIDFVKKIWDAIVNTFKRIWEFIVSLFSSNKAKGNDSRVDVVKEELKEIETIEKLPPEERQKRKSTKSVKFSKEVDSELNKVFDKHKVAKATVEKDHYFKSVEAGQLNISNNTAFRSLIDTKGINATFSAIEEYSRKFHGILSLTSSYAAMVLAAAKAEDEDALLKVNIGVGKQLSDTIDNFGGFISSRFNYRENPKLSIHIADKIPASPDRKYVSVPHLAVNQSIYFEIANDNVIQKPFSIHKVSLPSESITLDLRHADVKELIGHNEEIKKLTLKALRLNQTLDESSKSTEKLIKRILENFKEADILLAATDKKNKTEKRHSATNIHFYTVQEHAKFSLTLLKSNVFLSIAINNTMDKYVTFHEKLTKAYASYNDL